MAPWGRMLRLAVLLRASALAGRRDAAFEQLETSYDASMGATRPAAHLSGSASSLSSTFAAWALAPKSPHRAKRELRAVFEAQWANGMIPAYFGLTDGDVYGVPGLAFWNQSGLLTASSLPLAALPLQAIVALQIYAEEPNRAEAASFGAEVAQKLFRWHRYLHDQRSARDDGLVRLWHPWESLAPAQLWRPWCAAAGYGVDECSGLGAAAADDDPMLALADCVAECGFDAARVFAICGFGAKDAQFNGVLARADEALLRLIDALEHRHVRTSGLDDAARAQILGWAGALDVGRLADGGAFRSLWSTDATADSALWIRADVAVVGDATAVWAPRASRGDQARVFAELVIPTTPATFACAGDYEPLPEVECDRGPDAARRLRSRYTARTEGPRWPEGALAWPFQNALVERALRDAGAETVADWLRNATLDLVDGPCRGVEGCGFYAAYDRDGEGVPGAFGARNTSTLTAAAYAILDHNDPPLDDVVDPPVSRAVVFAIVCLELFIAFLVNAACVGANIVMIRQHSRNVTHERRTTPSLLPRRPPTPQRKPGDARTPPRKPGEARTPPRPPDPQQPLIVHAHSAYAPEVD
ncbi:hypothetical protein M885DRAFT_584075 [Pelagophyceae sp. CCMP2097]|nr:hypothetical protein M885DRAFT_584075 [Pelagophyceae sp. CCMP2097]